jgi:hypothetical protein
VIVSDFASAMVGSASRRAEELGLNNVECRVLDAERLDLPDGSVDAVLCRWGYMLMADLAAALRETRRALRADGRVACAVVAGHEQNPWAALPSRVLQQRGHIPPSEAGAPGILAPADRDRLRLLFTEAGFADPAIEGVAFGFRFAGVDDYWEFLNSAAGAIAMVLSRLGGDERERIRGEIAEQLYAFGASGQIELPTTSLVVSASQLNAPPPLPRAVASPDERASAARHLRHLPRTDEEEASAGTRSAVAPLLLLWSWTSAGRPAPTAGVHGLRTDCPVRVVRGDLVVNAEESPCPHRR